MGEIQNLNKQMALTIRMAKIRKVNKVLVKDAEK